MPYGNFPGAFYFRSGALQLSGFQGMAWDYSMSLSEFPWESIKWTDSKTGKSLPDYRRRIARGQNATTNFVGIKQYSSGVPCNYRSAGYTGNPVFPANYRKRLSVWDFNNVVIPNLPNSADINEADAIARSRFYKELERTSTLFQGGVFLGELKETLQLIANPARTLRKKLDDYINDVKRRRRGSPASKKKMLADKWLEHSFGWDPLLNDIDSANKYLDKRSEQLLQTLVRVRGEGRVLRSGFLTESAISGIHDIYATERYTFVTSKRYIGALSSTASSNKVMNMSSLGLSGRAFVPTLWEVLPWSFAADYFSNIGDVLSAWSNQSIKLAWGCETTRRQSTTDIIGQFARTKSLIRIDEQAFVGGSWQAVHKRIDRIPITYVPIPSINFEIPGFSKKWLNLAALGASRRMLTPF